MTDTVLILSFLALLGGGVMLYIGLFTGATQAVFSPKNANDALVELVCRALKDTPDHWSWDGYCAQHPDGIYVKPATSWSYVELRVNGREVELTAHQKQRVRDASVPVREGGSNAAREQRTDAVARRLIARIEAEMSRRPADHQPL